MCSELRRSFCPPLLVGLSEVYQVADSRSVTPAAMTEERAKCTTNLDEIVGENN
jgi:hypothetical protein